MPEDLSQGDQIVLRLLQESMGKGVPEQMRMKSYPSDGSVFITDEADTIRRHRATLAHEDAGRS